MGSFRGGDKRHLKKEKKKPKKSIKDRRKEKREKEQQERPAWARRPSPPTATRAGWYPLL